MSGKWVKGARAGRSSRGFFACCSVGGLPPTTGDDPRFRTSRNRATHEFGPKKIPAHAPDKESQARSVSEKQVLPPDRPDWARLPGRHDLNGASQTQTPSISTQLQIGVCEPAECTQLFDQALYVANYLFRTKASGLANGGNPMGWTNQSASFIRTILESASR